MLIVVNTLFIRSSTNNVLLQPRCFFALAASDCQPSFCLKPHSVGLICVYISSPSRVKGNLEPPVRAEFARAGFTS